MQSGEPQAPALAAKDEQNLLGAHVQLTTTVPLLLPVGDELVVLNFQDDRDHRRFLKI